ncbi:MAG: PHP domain-containing protein [Chloroflexota bacterium]|nr:PHP domain-containing protein [Chloroflexota bacterium]MDE2839733.1 PHP domain-containing protein [Chloroflexota bacterium]MDE2931890.1 PHP domain-containing protein [Chloroflexota bacterium]
MPGIDLHLHTTASDGAFAPADLVRMAYEAGLDCIAITDHDSTDGVAIAQEAGQGLGVRVIAGIEFNTMWHGQSVHILGYFVDTEHPELQAVIARQRDGRLYRAQKIIEKLATLDMPLVWEEILAGADGGAVGRPHIAKAMLAQGYVSEANEAFDRYLGHGMPAYVEQPKLTPSDAVMLLHRAGAAAGLAHPYNVEGADQVDLGILVPELADAGLDAIETYYTGYSTEQRSAILQMAQQFSLIPTGGSDFHGGGILVQAELGAIRVPPESLARLEAEARQRTAR